MLDFAVMHVPGQVFSAEDALQVLQEAGMAKGVFAMRRRWEADLVSVLRAEVPSFVPPGQGVTAYADSLVGHGMHDPPERLHVVSEVLYQPPLRLTR